MESFVWKETPLEPAPKSKYQESRQQHDAAASESGKARPRDETMNGASKAHLGLHWSPRFGHKSNRSNTSGKDISSDTVARKLDLTPHHEGIPIVVLL